MGNGVDRFEDLDVWKLADELRREVLEFTNKGLAAKDFKFRDQFVTQPRQPRETRPRDLGASILVNLPAFWASRMHR